MSIARARVNCFRCKNPVDKSQTIFSRSSNLEKQYVCFNCYNINKNINMDRDDILKVKVDLYCERCKYRFRASTTNCPYCSMSDMVTKGTVTMKDLAIERFM